MIPLRSMAWLVFPVVFPLAFTSLPPGAQISFTYENPKLEPQKYVLTVGEDGAGYFRSEVSAAPPDTSQSMPPASQNRPIHVSKAVREAMFATARKNKLFAISCEDGGKNIAFQGTKTLAYQGPEGQGSCTYNWSKSSQIDKLTDQFEAMASTMDEGAKLEREYEHGRLSLDQEMEVLEQLVHDGRAIELENIAPILEKLAGDEAVLQRVQRRARSLLQDARSD